MNEKCATNKMHYYYYHYYYYYYLLVNAISQSFIPLKSSSLKFFYHKQVQTPCSPKLRVWAQQKHGKNDKLLQNTSFSECSLAPPAAREPTLTDPSPPQRWKPKRETTPTCQRNEGCCHIEDGGMRGRKGGDGPVLTHTSLRMMSTTLPITTRASNPFQASPK